MLEKKDNDTYISLVFYKSSIKNRGEMLTQKPYLMCITYWFDYLKPLRKVSDAVIQPTVSEDQCHTPSKEHYWNEVYLIGQNLA